jgi:hypothetical protein
MDYVYFNHIVAEDEYTEYDGVQHACQETYGGLLFIDDYQYADVSEDSVKFELEYGPLSAVVAANDEW